MAGLHPCWPVASSAIKLMEAATLLALGDLAAGKPASAWHDELRDMAAVSIQLARDGVGPEVEPLAERVLEVLDDADPAAHLALLREMVEAAVAQWRACTLRRLARARERVIQGRATHLSPAPR